MGTAQKLKELRERKSLTQRQLADLCGVTYQSVQYWEREGGGAPKRSRLVRVAKVLGVSVSDLLPLEGEMDNEEEARLLEVFRALSKDKQLMAIRLVEVLK